MWHLALVYQFSGKYQHHSIRHLSLHSLSELLSGTLDLFTGKLAGTPLKKINLLWAIWWMLSWQRMFQTVVLDNWKEKLCVMWEKDKESQYWFWSQRSMENLKPRVLASTLMAQRPIARTALRTKSTSTSVAYSFSSASTCKESTPKWTPVWQGMSPKHQNTSRMYSSTANHAHPKLTLSNPAINLYFWNQRCQEEIQLGLVRQTWFRVAEAKRWLQAPLMNSWGQNLPC